MMDTETSIKLLFIILLVILTVLGVFRWLGRMKEEDEIIDVGIRRISKREFYKGVGTRRFSCMRKWIASSDTIDHFCGCVKGLNTYLFGLVICRYLTTISVCIMSVPATIPTFLVKKRSFTEEVGDMLGMNKHHPSLPAQLVDKCYVTAQNEAEFAAFLTPEMIGFFVNDDISSVEILEGDLMICHSLKNIRENYKVAIERSNYFVDLLMDATKKQLPTLG